MEGISFRLALPQDARRMADIRMDMLMESHNAAHMADETLLVRQNNEEYFARYIEDGSVAAWLAFDGETLVGTGSVNFSVNPPNFHCPSGRTAYIANIYTRPAYRGRGVATEILSRCVETAKVRECERITLNATKAGRPIYEKYGFKTAANAMSYYPSDSIGEGSN